MTLRHNIALCLVLSILSGAVPAAAGSDEQRQITWAGLTDVVGKTVKIVMPDGAIIQGKAAAVQNDGLAVDINKTSNKSTYPKGRFLVPRATLHTFSIDRPRIRGKVIGLAVGGGVGAFLALAASGSYIGGYRGALIGGAVALPVGGYFLGRAADSRTLTYVITQ